MIHIVFQLTLFSKLRGVEKIVAPTDFKVLIIGSGVSGICMGKKLNDVGLKYTILEKSANLGNQASYSVCIKYFLKYLLLFIFYTFYIFFSILFLNIYKKLVYQDLQRAIIYID